MVSINLLKSSQPHEHRVRRRSKAELSAGVVVLAGVCAVWGWMVVDESNAVQRLERAVQEKQARVTLLQQTRKQVLEMKEHQRTLLAEHDRLKALTGDLDRPLRLLSIISRVVDPLDVWLRHLQIEDEKMIVSGFAHSLDDITKLAKDFERTEMFGSVNVFETQAHAGRSDLFQFSMNVFMDALDHGRTNS